MIETVLVLTHRAVTIETGFDEVVDVQFGLGGIVLEVLVD